MPANVAFIFESMLPGATVSVVIHRYSDTRAVSYSAGIKSQTSVQIDTDGSGAIPEARVYCELCGTETHTFTTADVSGFYIFPGSLASGGGVWLFDGRTPVYPLYRKQGLPRPR